jgi:hypothetical protein
MRDRKWSGLRAIANLMRKDIVSSIGEDVVSHEGAHAPFIAGTVRDNDTMLAKGLNPNGVANLEFGATKVVGKEASALVVDSAAAIGEVGKGIEVGGWIHEKVPFKVTLYMRQSLRSYQ